MFTVSFSPTKQYNIGVVAHPKFISVPYFRRKLCSLSSLQNGSKLTMVLPIQFSISTVVPLNWKYALYLYDLPLLMLQYFPVFSSEWFYIYLSLTPTKLLCFQSSLLTKQQQQQKREAGPRCIFFILYIILLLGDTKLLNESPYY